MRAKKEKTAETLDFNGQVDVIIAKANALNKVRDIVNTFPLTKCLKIKTSPTFVGKHNIVNVSMEYNIPHDVVDSRYKIYTNGDTALVPADWVHEHVKDGITQVCFEIVHDIVKGTMKFKFKYIWDKTTWKNDALYYDRHVYISDFQSVCNVLNGIIGWRASGVKKTAVKRLTSDVNFFRDALKLIVEAIKSDDINKTKLAIHNITMDKAISAL